MQGIGSCRSSRPLAYITMHDPSARARIIETLERAGWVVIPQPTGFHLLQAIADVIEGKYTWLDPMLIVIDAYARGCAGTTIAAGLRDLGIRIPIVLITTPDQPPPLTSDEALRIVDSSHAAEVVAALARPGGPQPRDRPSFDAALTAAGNERPVHLQSDGVGALGST